MSSNNRQKIHISEVVMRDGLQNEPIFIATADKVDLVDDLSKSGVDKIEVTAFVSSHAVPVLRDASQVMRRIQRSPHLEYSALVPNLRRAEAAIDSGADEINFVMSASEAHNRANVRMSHEQSLGLLGHIAQRSRRAKVQLNGTVSTAFGCSIAGPISLSRALGIVQRYNDLGVSRITLADTVGMAHPRQVRDAVLAFKDRFPALQLTLHFHDTRGLGLANVVAAVEAGADRFDTALGGLGGCPFAPGATGNVCTVDTVHMLEAMGFDTGADITVLTRIAKRLATLLQRDLPGRVIKAGPATLLT